MAIGANELALRDLSKEHLWAIALDERADVGQFDRSRQVIPLHHGVMEEATAIGAWLSRLQGAVPRHELLVTFSSLQPSSRTCSLVVQLVIGTTTTLAPGLPDASPSVEFVQG
jgi:hypothetical protein